MIGSGKWALTVNELESGKFHFTLLLAVASPDDFLSFQPVITDERAFGRAESAWMAGAVALADRTAQALRPLRPISTGPMPL